MTSPRHAIDDLLDSATEEELERFNRAIREVADATGWRVGRSWPARRTILAEGTDSQPEVSTMTPVAGTDLWVRSSQRYTAVGGDLPCEVTMLVTFDGTTPRCVQTTFTTRDDRDRVTSTMLRRVPLDQLVKEAALEHARVFVRRPDGQFVAGFFPDGRDREGLRSAATEGRRRTPHEYLEHAADIYRRALATGKNPTAAVEREMGLPNRNTAKKRVQQARSAGLLDPAPGPRRAGLVPPTKAKRKQEGKPR